MSQPAHIPNAWIRARERFMEDLSEDEKHKYLEASPESIFYEASAAEKIHQSKSKSRKILEKLQPFVNSVKAYGEALDVFANTYPLVMSPLWGGFRIVLILARETGQYFDRIASMFVQIGNVLPRLHIYETLFPHHERLLQTLSTIYCDLLQFCYDAKKVLRKPKRSLFTTSWKGFESQFGQVIGQFEEHQRLVEKEVKTSHLIESADSRSLARSDQLQAAQERKENERWQVFRALCAVDYEEQLAKLTELRHEGTGEWFTRATAFKAWTESATSSGLCCRGIPGSGKSILMAKFISDQANGTSRTDTITLYHFCNFSEPLSLQPSQVYRTILKQIFVLGLMFEDIIDAIVLGFRKAAGGTHERELLSLCIKAISSCDKVNFVFDGLDECDDDSQRKLCDFLNRLTQFEQPRIKVLMTCREEEKPLKYLKRFRHLQLTIKASMADMESYVSSRIRFGVERNDIPLRDPSLEEEVVRALVSNAQGMYLWVHFQILELSEAASPAAIREILGNLPHGLSETYERIIDRVSISSNAIYAQRAMRWVACARRPISIGELQEAVAFTTSDMSWDIDKVVDGDKLLQSCRGLIVREKNSKVRFAHHTVRQFLLVSNDNHQSFGLNKKNHPFLFTIGHAERTIAEMCATYLCFSDFESALVTSERQRHLTINTIFRNGGPAAIPAALGLNKSIHSISYKLFGSRSNMKIPDIEFCKYVGGQSAQGRPSLPLRTKYALLDYVVEFWPWHTKQKLDCKDCIQLLQPDLKSFLEEIARQIYPLDEQQDAIAELCFIGLLKTFRRFWNTILERSFSFKTCPWGTNQHFGPNGCSGCPPPSESEELVDLSGMSALHWAAQSGHLPIFHLYEISLPHYTNHERYHQQTLILASKYGHLEVVSLLLNAGADALDKAALHESCQAGQIEVLRCLIRTAGWQRPGSSVNLVQQKVSSMRFGPQQKTLGHCAAEYGQLDIVQYLFDEALISWDTDADGRTLLHYTVMGGNANMAALLVKHRMCRLDAQDLEDETPLMFAAKLGHVKIVQVLLAAGAESNLRRGKYGIPLPTNFPVALIGLDYLVDIKEPAHLGPMAIHLAAIEGHAGVLEALPSENLYSESIAYYNVRNSQTGSRAICLSVMQWAIVYGHVKAVEFFINNGVCLDQIAEVPYVASCDHFFTELHLAIATDNGALVDMLLKYGADSGMRTAWGFAPIHIAAMHDRQDALRVLLTEQTRSNPHLDCQVESRFEHTMGGWTALDQAVYGGNTDVVRMLVEAGANPMIASDKGNASVCGKHCPIFAALEQDNMKCEILTLLYEATAPLFSDTGINDRTILSYAALQGSPRKVQHLLDLGAKDAWTSGCVLLMAVISDRVEIVSILLNHPDLYHPRERILQEIIDDARLNAWKYLETSPGLHTITESMLKQAIKDSQTSSSC